MVALNVPPTDPSVRFTNSGDQGNPIRRIAAADNAPRRN